MLKAPQMLLWFLSFLFTLTSISLQTKHWLVGFVSLIVQSVAFSTFLCVKMPLTYGHMSFKKFLGTDTRTPIREQQPRPSLLDGL